MIRVFDAFSGIGWFQSAFERVGGFKTVGWCEIDRFAQKSYRALFDTGGEQFYENIRDIDTAVQTGRQCRHGECRGGDCKKSFEI